jgi:hypothetical protein
MPWNPELRSAPHSVSSPEAGLRRRVRPRVVRWLALAALASSCSRNAHSVRLPGLSPDDEVYRISCDDTIAHCREEANEVCAGRYQVLESTGAPVEPPRITSAPGPASTGPRYQRVKWVGQMVVACGETSELAHDATPGGQQPAPAPTAAAPKVAARPPADRLCIPGVTQECLGPAACRGAQACLPDGNGYGACDCGNASARARPGADAGASPER